MEQLLFWLHSSDEFQSMKCSIILFVLCLRQELYKGLITYHMASSQNAILHSEGGSSLAGMGVIRQLVEASHTAAKAPITSGLRVWSKVFCVFLEHVPCSLMPSEMAEIATAVPSTPGPPSKISEKSEKPAVFSPL
ncbi:hypothetical protein MHYP_G00331170 [Metynnis hypsauchen]